MMQANGKFTTRAEETIKIFLKYYQKAYKSESGGPGKMASLLNLAKIAKISQEHRDILEAPIDLEEINAAVFALHCKSSPGPDGLTSEFYKKFKYLIALYLHEVFMICLEDEKIPHF